MHRWTAIISALVIISGVALIARTSEQASTQPAEGWSTLFDGKDLSNWNPIGTAKWRLEDGAVVADSGNGFLVSKNDYGDFHLRVEFWIEAKTNSGVFIRCTDPNNITLQTSYEVNIWDTRPEPKYGTGAIVNIAAVDPMPHAADKWNVYEIIAKGATFTVILNGQKTVDGVNDSKFAKGRIALQHGKGVTDESGVVKFRKVEIKPL
jgi:3-keto-disaccharide hydrolase